MNSGKGHFDSLLLCGVTWTGPRERQVQKVGGWPCRCGVALHSLLLNHFCLRGSSCVSSSPWGYLGSDNKSLLTVFLKQCGCKTFTSGFPGVGGGAWGKHADSQAPLQTYWIRTSGSLCSTSSPGDSENADTITPWYSESSKWWLAYVYDGESGAISLIFAFVYRFAPQAELTKVPNTSVQSVSIVPLFHTVFESTELKFSPVLN